MITVTPPESFITHTRLSAFQIQDFRTKSFRTILRRNENAIPVLRAIVGILLPENVHTVTPLGLSCHQSTSLGLARVFHRSRALTKMVVHGGYERVLGTTTDAPRMSSEDNGGAFVSLSCSATYLRQGVTVKDRNVAGEENIRTLVFNQLRFLKPARLWKGEYLAHDAKKVAHTLTLHRPDGATQSFAPAESERNGAQLANQFMSPLYFLLQVCYSRCVSNRQFYREMGISTLQSIKGPTRGHDGGSKPPVFPSDVDSTQIRRTRESVNHLVLQTELPKETFTGAYYGMEVATMTDQQRRDYADECFRYFRELSDLATVFKWLIRSIDIYATAAGKVQEILRRGLPNVDVEMIDKSRGGWASCTPEEWVWTSRQPTRMSLVFRLASLKDLHGESTPAACAGGVKPGVRRPRVRGDDPGGCSTAT